MLADRRPNHPNRPARRRRLAESIITGDNNLLREPDRETLEALLA